MVVFITENKLREIYKKQPFKEYELKLEEKLTPGGRQYLLDKSIKIVDYNEKKYSKEKNEIDEKSKYKDYKKEKLYYKLKNIEILILKESAKLIEKDIDHIRELIDLSKDILNLSLYIRNDEELNEISYKLCTGLNEKNIRENLDICMDITDIIMGLKDREILLGIYTILYELKAIQYELKELEDDKKQKIIYENINIVTNKLNQMICKIIGGVKCQRTINVSNTVID